jgi:catechol 2,3-dioxygenase
VHLRTANLARVLDFYEHVIGLKVIERVESGAALSTTASAPALLVFSEDRNAVPRPRRATGLYHFAIRFPSRRDLAHAVRRLVAAEYPIEGASDHGVSEAIYLSDPDGNGVELYSDRPRSEWPMRDGQLQMVTQALDFDDLLGPVEGSVPANAPALTDIGHIHLHVADLAVAERFFHEFLGLAVMQRMAHSATFLSAGGYHHHIAVNVWVGKTPAPENAVGLVSYRLEIPDAEAAITIKERAQLFGHETRIRGDLFEVIDPNGNALELEFTVKSVAACV